jgi:type VI secretion system protein ImpL
MNARWLLARFSSWPAAALTLGWLLLAGWAVALAAAAVQLDAWREDLSRTLLQLDADAQFRARAHTRDAVDPEWYRRKALALLSATQRLQDDKLWTVFVPGSWQRFDNLEEQVQQRLEHEFSEIVVETMRRELYARASKLTGIPLVRGTGELQGGAECQSPVPQNVDRKLAAAAEDLPEFVSVSDYVREVERLDRALQSFQSLQFRSGAPEQLRELVAYTLDKELPGALVGAVRMFHAGDEVNLQPALLQSNLQWATRCSLAKAMSALMTRLLNTNDLFALEQGLVERSRGLFDTPVRPASFDRTLERYRAVHGLLEDQHALLAKGHNDWMGQGTLQLGAPYQQVLQRIEHTRLLGPEVVQQLRDQSGQAFTEFRRQFELAFGGGGEPGIVWMEDEKRFGLSTERAALREGLGELLKTSFMSDDAGRPAKDAGGSLTKVLQDARGLAEERERALGSIVPMFPEHAQAMVTRVVDSRVSELIYQRAFRTLKASLPTDSRAPLDALAFRQQRDQVIALRDVLKETGGAGLGDRLVATLDGELLRRLALLQEDWKQQPLESPRADDFAWWLGDPLPLAQTLGAADANAASFAPAATRLDALVQRAKALVALGSPAFLRDATAQRWVQLEAELDRYKARSPESSLVRLEKYVAALGPDLRRENCIERLAANLPQPVGDDEIALRHLQLHQALSRRCVELRLQPVIPASPAALPPTASPSAAAAQ